MKTITSKQKLKKVNKNDRQVFVEEGNTNSNAGTIPSITEFKGTEQTDLPVGVYIKSVTSNSSPQRLGFKDRKESLTVTIRDNSIARTIVIGSEYTSKKAFGMGLQGKDVKNFQGFASNLLPRISINSDANSYDNILELNVFGQGSFHKTYDENYNFIPFRDFGKLNPVDLIGKTHVTSYPFVNDLKINFEQFVDPSISSFDGAVDVLTSRQSLIDNDIRSVTVNSFKGQLMGGGLDYAGKGSSLIESRREIKSGNKEIFLDSAETMFNGFDFPRTGITGSSGNKFAIQGYSSDSMYTLSPFSEENFRDSSNVYSLLTNEQKELLLKASDRTKSEIGDRFKSSNNGFIFGESNPLGTDSIAFGGFKK